MRTRGILYLAAAAAVLLWPVVRDADASGFAIVEQSARTIGNAFAGATVDTGDGGSIYFNPAGITEVPHGQVSAGAHVILPSFEFSDSGSTPVGGGNGGDAGVTAYVPNLYGVLALTDKLRAGLGVHAPYGLQTEYDKDWVGRYAAIKTELMTLNVNPTLAYRLSENLSVGAGFSAQYANATLTSAAPIPGLGDVEAEVEGDDWGYGWNVGVLCTLDGGTRLGMAYRSAIDHTLEGGITIGPLPHDSGTADLNLPETAAIGIYQPVGDLVAVMADVTWTGWSCFDELKVVNSSGALVSFTDESWDDTFRYAVGVDVHASECLVLRCGVAYDESPVPDAAHRTPRIPDSDRTWLSLGAGLDLDDTLRIDLGYTHLFISDSDVDFVYDPMTGATIEGTYEGGVDIVSVQASWTL